MISSIHHLRSLTQSPPSTSLSALSCTSDLVNHSGSNRSGTPKPGFRHDRNAKCTSVICSKPYFSPITFSHHYQFSIEYIHEYIAGNVMARVTQSARSGPTTTTSAKISHRTPRNLRRIIYRGPRGNTCHRAERAIKRRVSVFRENTYSVNGGYE